MPKTERKTITAQTMYQIYNSDNLKAFIAPHTVNADKEQFDYQGIIADFRDMINAYQAAKEAELQPQAAEETAAPEVASESALSAR